RLNEWPDRSSARLSYHPQTDGLASVEVAIAERVSRPHGAIAWSGAAAEAAINREADVTVPGWTGSGELWTASWRWWSARPRVAMSFAAPHTGTLPGVWRVDASWDRQAYVLGPLIDGPAITETQTHGGFTVSAWVTAGVRYG